MLKETGEETLNTMILLGSIIVVAFVGFVILLAYLFTTRKNKLIQEKQLMKTQFEQELLQTQLEIQEQTLKTISEEIHDNVGQVLSLAKLNLNTFETHPEKKLQDTKALISKAINDLRDLSRSMHGDRITELGLQQSVADELQILQNTGQFVTYLKIIGAAYKLLPQKEMVLFRIVQEALNNCIKYSKAKNISVALNYDKENFLLHITDDGIGFDTHAKTGIGLKSMQNRAALIGGEFSIQSSAGNGTLIIITLLKEAGARNGLTN